MENINEKKDAQIDMQQMRIPMVSSISNRSEELSKQEMQKSILEQTTNTKNKRKGSIKRICKQCGNEFYTKQCFINKGGGKYCSRHCAGIVNSTGRKLSEKTKEKIAIANIGKTMDKKTREKISAKLTGIKRGPQSDERRKKASITHKNVTQETRQKISKANKGRKLTEDHKQKIKNEHLSQNSKIKRGKNHPCWKGGISFEPYCEKWNNKLKERIRAFFEYRCIICGKHQKELKRKLHCHHVEYNKKACCDGKLVHFAAMCGKHHIMTNRDRERWETMLHRIIDEIYNGRSYYTEEEYNDKYDSIVEMGK
jgi:hypothetical protein